MKKRTVKLDIGELTSVALLVAVLIVFIVLSKGNLFSLFNMRSILDQAMIYIIGGLGTIFVVAQGGADLSLGATLAVSTVVGCMAAVATGNELMVFPVAIAIGLAQGFLNGFLVSKLKIPSFMATLAFLIGMRGFMLFLQQTFTDGFYAVAGPLKALKADAVKFPLLIALVVVFYFILSNTRFGNYCKAIGENEAVAVNVGIPVAKMKIAAFMLSGFMAAIAGFFQLAKYGGTNNAMGLNLEMNVLVGIFVGGVLVTGGYGTKITKLLIGCFTVSVIQVGMTVTGHGETYIVQITEGLVLIAILFVVVRLKDWEGKRSTLADEAMLESS
jgi:ribose transport system permease protein